MLSTIYSALSRTPHYGVYAELGINAIIRDGFIQKMEDGFQNFAWVKVHIASLV
jgi:hypothetical protein